MDDHLLLSLTASKSEGRMFSYLQMAQIGGSCLFLDCRQWGRIVYQPFAKQTAKRASATATATSHLPPPTCYRRSCCSRRRALLISPLHCAVIVKPIHPLFTHQFRVAPTSAGPHD